MAIFGPFGATNRPPGGHGWFSLYSLIVFAASMGHFGAENLEFLAFRCSFRILLEIRKAQGGPRKPQEAPGKALEVSRGLRSFQGGLRMPPELKDGWRQNRSVALRSVKCVTVVINKGSMGGVKIARSHLDR